jgi:hypothetical protein
MLVEIEQMDEREFRALTGISKAAFMSLLPEFELSCQTAVQANYEQNKAKRKRKPGGGQKGKLNRPARKLFFVLRYFKSYPTFDELGHEFGLDRSKACTNVHRLASILMQTLTKLGVLPHRQFESLEQMKEAFVGIEELFIDATERPHCRPKEQQAQKEKYSGKKTPYSQKHTHHHRLQNDFVSRLHRGG